MSKLSKASVHYSKGMPQAHCGICAHFERPDACELVEGPIDAGMWCTRFSRARETQKMLFNDILKDSPSVADVHVSATGQGKRKRQRLPLVVMTAAAPAKPTTKFRIDVPIVKRDDELRTVYGWASVIAESGNVVTDHQGDRIGETELVKAAHEFVAASRHGGLLHAADDQGAAFKGGEVVESLVLTPDVQKALGVDLGKVGWFIGYRVADPDAWDLVKAGTLRSFSIGGAARREPA